MKFKADVVVKNSNNVLHNEAINIKTDLAAAKELQIKDAILYPPFINGHEHLVGNWYPRSGVNRPYKNADIWVEDMKSAPSYKERNKVWINDGKFDLMKGNAKLLTALGIYKNIFCGCNVVQDHASRQKDEYYESFPIKVLKKYRQCHSISMGNWWGDKEPLVEWQETKGKMPFILHLAEGTDERSSRCFPKLKEIGLLQPNTLIIHGIALTKKDIEECAEVGTSICWCPGSNLFLIGETLNVPYALKSGVNVILGTDSTQSGSLNLFKEMQKGYSVFPEIKAKDLYKMITENSRKALFLSKKYGTLSEQSEELLILKRYTDNPFQNLLKVTNDDIRLFIHKGKPIYGEEEFFPYFNLKEADYYFFEKDKTRKFVIGHPEKVLDKINHYLGYKKDFPFLPI